MLRENNRLRPLLLGFAALAILAISLTPGALAWAQEQATQEKPEQRYQESVKKQLKETTQQEHKGEHGHSDVQSGEKDGGDGGGNGADDGYDIPGGSGSYGQGGYGSQGNYGYGDQYGYPQRGDETWGTMGDNIYMGDDPMTGDRIIRVTPKPQPRQDQQEPQIGPIIIEPHITIPQQGGQKQQP